MQNPNSHVVVYSRRLRSRSNRPKRFHATSNHRPNPQQYQPQVFIDDDQESQLSLEQPQNQPLDAQEKGIWHQIFMKDKLINLCIILIPYLYFLDWFLNWVSIHDLPFYSIHQQEKLLKQMQDSLSKSFQFMSANLHADPIMDLQIINHISTCPPGFEALKLGTWPETVAGCLCENGDFHAVSCKKVGSDKCQKDIPETSPIEIYKWDNSIWCAKRAILETDYLRKVECPLEYKECYPGGCFKENCPITKIEMEATDKLILTRTKGELPIINVQITFGDISCFTQDLSAQSTNEFPSVRESHCDLNHHFSTVLASQTAYDSFIQNTLPYPVTNIPNFEKNTKATSAILSSMNRIKTAKNDYCVNITNEKVIDKFKRGWLLFNESMWLIWTFVLFCLVIYRAVHIFQFYIRSKNSEDNPKPMLYLFYFSSSLLMFGLVVTFRGLKWKLYNMKEYFEGFYSLECFEGSQASKVISDTLGIIRKIEGSFWVYWVLFIASFLSFFILYRFFFGKKKLS